MLFRHSQYVNVISSIIFLIIIVVVIGIILSLGNVPPFVIRTTRGVPLVRIAYLAVVSCREDVLELWTDFDFIMNAFHGPNTSGGM